MIEEERLGHSVVTPEVIDREIDNIKDNFMSPCVDWIAPGHAKHISMPLAHVFNMSLVEGRPTFSMERSTHHSIIKNILEISP